MTERINAQQVAWLVESEPGGLWWDGRFVSRGIDPRFFTRDPNEAIRFARREDAEKVASSSSALKATEHIWLAAQPQQAAQGWVCAKCGTDRCKAPCPLGYSAALTGQCPMTGTAAAQPQQAISAPAQIDLSNEWPTTRYFVKQVMARFGIGPNEDIASALRKLYAEAPAQPQQASPNSSST